MEINPGNWRPSFRYQPDVRRGVFTIAAASSFQLCLLTIWGWVESYRHGLSLTHNVLRDAHGQILRGSWAPDPRLREWTQDEWLVLPGFVFLRRDFRRTTPPTYMNPNPEDTQTVYANASLLSPKAVPAQQLRATTGEVFGIRNYLSFAGFGYASESPIGATLLPNDWRSEFVVQNSSTYFNSRREFLIPFWPFVMLLAILPVTWGWSIVRQTRKPLSRDWRRAFSKSSVGRYAIVIASSLSIEFSLLIALAWYETYRYTFSVEGYAQRADIQYFVDSMPGRLHLRCNSTVANPPRKVDRDWTPSTRFSAQVSLIEPPASLKPPGPFGALFGGSVNPFVLPHHWSFGSFGYATNFGTVPPIFGGPGLLTQREFLTPFWPFVALFAVLPIAFVSRAIRRRHRYASHCCQSCGYDLTGNISGICSECGSTI
jgi:hypothetical protein